MNFSLPYDRKENWKDEFLSLKLESKIVPDFNKYYNTDLVIVSNNRQYIFNVKCFHTFQDNIFYSAKLYNLDTSQLIKVFEGTKGGNQFKFTEDSTTLVIQNKEYFLIYKIQQAQEVKIPYKGTPQIRFSIGQQIFLLISQNIITIVDSNTTTEYPNLSQNTNWKFSESQNMLLNLRKNQNQNQLSISFYRIKKQKIILVYNILSYEKSEFLLEKFKYFKEFSSKLIILYSFQKIKIFTQTGKLIKKILTSSQFYRTIKMKKDLQGNSVLVCISEPDNFQFYPNKSIGYMQLLPEIKAQLVEISQGDGIFTNIPGPLYLQSHEKNYSTFGQLWYLV